MTDIADDIVMKEEGTGSEAEALADILAWSKDCPEWQRDALRRLCVKGELDDADLDELTVLCKSKSKGNGSVPLVAGHIPDPDASGVAVTLRAIHSAENVNALKPGERLTFDKTGLTVVYGDNGSGKSGYARILKKACRARTPPKGDRILPNIYAKKTGPQKAVIDFGANGHSRSQNWTTDVPGDPLLSSVSVFDSRTANVHVDEVNDVAYTPFPMRVLECLAEACQEIRKRIKAQIRELEQQTPEAIAKPECHDWTAVGKLITALGGSTKEQDVRSLAALDENEKARHETLKTDLVRNPTKVASQLEALKNRLNATNAAFGSLQNAVSDQQVNRLTALYQTCRTTQAAATAAANDLFAGEPLPNIGSDVWRSLWEAARRYSEHQAYPDMPFPMTGRGARCVLCQQELGAEAADRLTRFEAFVKDETKRKEELAAAAYRAALDVMNGADIPAAEIPVAVALIRDELNDGELAKIVRRAAVTLKGRLRAIRRDHTKGDDAGPLPGAENWPTDAVAAHSVSMSARIIALRAEEESDERKQMRVAFEGLSDRAWLAVIQEDVIAEIGRRKKRAALDAVAKDTTTNRITAKSGEITEHLVSNALRAQFSKEIDKIGVAGLAIELRKEKTSYGVPHFRVSLIRKPDARVGEILSEGEHRCVALAAFLAELATIDSRSAVVFDDPVSSLDHMHRGAVAERLADEAQHRQIIVLTHDIAFLFLLDQSCREKDTHLAFRCVTRTDDYTGFIQQAPPLRAQPVDKVIDGMQTLVDNEKILYENGNHDKWERTVDALQKRLRWTWERAVEEAISPVFKRMSEKVQTKGLSKITALTMDDCTEMRKAYGRCSTLLHSSPDTLSPALPKPEAVQNEITALRNWVVNIRQRQGNINLLQ